MKRLLLTILLVTPVVLGMAGPPAGAQAPDRNDGALTVSLQVASDEVRVPAVSLNRKTWWTDYTVSGPGLLTTTAGVGITRCEGGGFSYTNLSEEDHGAMEMDCNGVGASAYCWLGIFRVGAVAIISGQCDVTAGTDMRTLGAYGVLDWTPTSFPVTSALLNGSIALYDEL